MSAFKDQQPGVTFIYTNFYDHYKSLTQKSELKRMILKKESTPIPAKVTVVNAEEQDQLSQWVQSSGKKSMAQGLLELRESRKRFNYLLSEIEDLLKRD